MFCKKCGYALIGLETQQCPECGRKFDPANQKTFAQKPPRSRAWRWGKWFAALTLLLVLIAGAGLAWLWWGWHAEQPTIAQLRKLNQKFSVTPIGPERLRRMLGTRLGYLMDRVDAVALENLKSADADALELGSLSQVETLGLFDCQVSNTTLSRLAHLKKLQRLSLWNIKIENPDFAFLEKLPALDCLLMAGDWTGDVNFEQIGRLKHLRALDFPAARMKDSDLQSLQGLSSLKRLSFFDFPPGDIGLEHLEPLNHLHGIEHGRTRVTDSGVTKLKQAIPGLKID